MMTTRGWRAALPAALLAATAAGCASGASSVTSVPGTLPAAGISARNMNPPGACSPWAGLDALSAETTWLRQLVGDEVIYGAGTRQDRRDGRVVIAYARSLDGFGATLAPRYARELRGSVLPAATRPYAKTPEQLNTAANAAQTLNGQLDAAC